MRVTKRGVILLDDFKDNKTLAHVVEVMNHRKNIDSDIIELVRESFSLSIFPCPFCIEAHSLDFAVCLFCHRMPIESEVKP
ncbi:unnamed protein product [marine sediment metagenome]|uniref:Uncharacterized protein n=1 Tax=marine sediment metagenome TaxID=412755 RepID=X1GTP7_9ZZZZ